MKTNSLRLLAIALGACLATPGAFAQTQDEIPPTPPIATPPTQGDVLPPPVAGKTPISANDRAFLDQALASGEKEVHAAALAQTRSDDADVRDLAITIEKDHRDLNAKLVAAGADSAVPDEAQRPHGAKQPGDPGATSPSSAGASPSDDVAAHSALHGDPAMDGLLDARGAGFDKAYLDMLVTMHAKSIERFERVANGQEHSEKVRSLAGQALPALRRHAAMASSLQQAMMAKN